MSSNCDRARYPCTSGGRALQLQYRALALQQRSQLPNAHRTEASMHLHCLYGCQASFVLHAILVARVKAMHYACDGQGTPIWPVHPSPIVPQGVSRDALRHRDVHSAIVSVRSSCPYACAGDASTPVRYNSQCAVRRVALIRAPGKPGERRAHLCLVPGAACACGPQAISRAAASLHP